jgi:hypothetical protein
MMKPSRQEVKIAKANGVLYMFNKSTFKGIASWTWN